MTDRDRINRIDALCEIERFRQGIYCSKEQNDENDWGAAYSLQALYVRVKRPPRSTPSCGKQLIRHSKLIGKYHVCSECGKLIPYIDWSQPYCSGCGCLFSNFTEFTSDTVKGDKDERHSK